MTSKIQTWDLPELFDLGYGGDFEVFVMDNHRPVHLKNIQSGESVTVFVEKYELNDGAPVEFEDGDLVTDDEDSEGEGEADEGDESEEEDDDDDDDAMDVDPVEAAAKKAKWSASRRRLAMHVQERTQRAHLVHNCCYGTSAAHQVRAAGCSRAMGSASWTWRVRSVSPDAPSPSCMNHTVSRFLQYCSTVQYVGCGTWSGTGFP